MNLEVKSLKIIHFVTNSIKSGKGLTLLEIQPKMQTSENIVEKGENAGYQHFLLCQQYFMPSQRQKLFGLPPICCLHMFVINSLPDNKILDWSKLKHFIVHLK